MHVTRLFPIRNIIIIPLAHFGQNPLYALTLTLLLQMFTFILVIRFINKRITFYTVYSMYNKGLSVVGHVTCLNQLLLVLIFVRGELIFWKCLKCQESTGHVDRRDVARRNIGCNPNPLFSSEPACPFPHPVILFRFKKAHGIVWLQVS